jgi:5-hydroxyisourate hydrolase
MKSNKKFCVLPALALAMPFFAFADISVHVLDTNLGQPGPDIKVSFYKKMKDSWAYQGTQKTDKNGRIKKFDFNKSDASGEYRVVFHVADYFKLQKADSFYNEIPVDFKVENTKEHYHIPLLLSPYAYSTYRGN